MSDNLSRNAPETNWYSRHAVQILLLWLALLVYGSLYPWEFQFTAAVQAAGGFWPSISRTLVFPHVPLEDLFVNVALYIPVGALASALLRNPRAMVRVLAPVLFAFGLSFLIEILQSYEPLRYGNLSDVALNVFGALCGSIAAEAIRAGGFEPVHFRRFQSLPAAALLLVWLISMLFPFVPVENLTVAKEKLTLFWVDPMFRFLPLLSQSMNWMAVGWMLRLCGVRRPGLLTGTAVLLFAGQFVIATRQPVLSDVVGAILGWLLFLWSARRHTVRTVAWTYALFIGVHCALAPEPYPVVQNQYSWVPFAGVIEHEWHTALGLLLDAMFLYGAGIWLLHAAGRGLTAATFTIAAIAGAGGLLQFYIPERAPDITDPFLALLVGYGLGVLFWFSRPHPVSGNPLDQLRAHGAGYQQRHILPEFDE